MHYPYGYIRNTVGADEEHIDVYLGPDKKEEKVFIVHQMKKPDFEEYDEDKVMLGFSSAREAKAAYQMHYNNPKFFGTMTETTVEDFKRMFVNKSAAADLNKGLLDQLNKIWNKVRSKFGGSEELPKATKKWVKDGNENCKTGVCYRLDGQEIPLDAQFEAMNGMMIDGPPAHKYCNCRLEFSMNKSMMYGSFDSVNGILQQIGAIPDEQIMAMAGEIWGSGYQYKNPQKARTELLGFLMDQRDLLSVPQSSEKPSLEPSPSLPVKEPGGSSEYYGTSPNSVKEAVNVQGDSSYEEGYNPNTSNGSPMQDSWRRPKSA